MTRPQSIYPAVALPLRRPARLAAAVAPTDLGVTGTVTIGGYTLHVDDQTATITVPSDPRLPVSRRPACTAGGHEHARQPSCTVPAVSRCRSGAPQCADRLLSVEGRRPSSPG
ncbi:hypothetical protein Are01nite_85720 [Actinoplanes regularis]|nr:hypothetical protein Are01nite_85720 [Actinoplanes regularis]